MTYRCVICEQDFESLEDAIEITGGRGSRSRKPVVYRFPDGSLHHLVKSKKPKPPQLPVLDPKKENPELLQEVVNVLAALPTPPVPEPEPKTEILPLAKPEIEEEPIPMTAMQHAFRRSRKAA